ncbi:MAG: DUF222 domain-containing protein [Chloroflexi bacterium]|nr:MAG: DUF222 domain-containing protein [Chloroflexota bacterium]
MRELRAAISVLEAEDDDFIDLRELSSLIDRLQGKLCRVVAAARKRGEHLLAGQSPCSWVALQCQMSRTSAADRLCVGEELAHLPRIAQALSSGEIGFQAASVICHLSEQIGEKRAYIEEEDWIGFARRFSIKDLRYLTHEAAGGAALKSALESLSRPLGADDGRTSKQRRADSLVELVHHAMDRGTLPRRNGVRPHVSVHTTIEGLKGELGAAAAHLEGGMPISNKTVQRLACDGSLHRVLKADSMVIDVGRAKRTAQPAQGSPRNHGAGAPAGPPPDLRRAWLRPADRDDQRPPRRLLGRRRAHQPAEDDPPLLPPPPPGPRRRLPGRARGREGGVHPARPAGHDQAPVG